MRSWDDIPRAEIDAWAADPVNYCPGGGESVLQMTQRIHSFLQTVSVLKWDTVVIICHAGTMRLFMELENAVSETEAALSAACAAHRIAYGGLLIYEYTENG
jgi:alpha-ribazole phosphatase